MSTFKKQFFKQLLFVYIIAAVASAFILRVAFNDQFSHLEGGGQSFLFMVILILIIILPILSFSSIISLFLRVEKNLSNKKKFTTLFFAPVLTAAIAICVVSMILIPSEGWTMNFLPISVCVCYLVLWMRAHHKLKS